MFFSSMIRLVKIKLVAAIRAGVRDDLAQLNHLAPEDEAFYEIWVKCRPYTMTSLERGLALYRAIRYLVENNIPGDIVECGVWRGGSSMIAMATLCSLGVMDRRVLMFDTYEGMTNPSAADVDNSGNTAQDLFVAHQGRADGILCYATLNEVRNNVNSIGYPTSLVEFVVGDIRETIKQFVQRPIALLRLDTDFYDSTKVELEMFYPSLVGGGVLIIDDYGHWQGARKAVDEYWASLRKLDRRAPLLSIIDYTGRLAIK
ncbi:MAG: TylF/MycF/NovP-related O-methyltransferase [Sulfuricellaceae bacterium]|nr:TylF/MycF/NovP-related O-methyltransferase [Sulfuricellaceae bacterium]